jgi:hypothetical protein
MNVVKGTVKAIRDHVLVTDMKFDQRITRGGIILMNDNGKDVGIRPRWAKVYAVGSEQKDVEVGQWVMVSHGRWTRGIELQEDDNEDNIQTIRRVDINDILLVSDEQPPEHEM